MPSPSISASVRTAPSTPATSVNPTPAPSTQVRILQPSPSIRWIRVRAAHEGMTLIDFFTTRFPYLSTDEWRGRMSEGWIRMDGTPGAPDPETRLKPGQRLQLLSDHVVEPAVPSDVAVIQSDPGWLVVFKPAPLPIHAGGRYVRNTLLGILEEQGYPALHPVHRLDAVTSGLICLARTPLMAEQLAAAFTSGRAVKGYHALVAGHPAEESAVITEPIRRKIGFVFECGHDLGGDSSAKPAETRFEVMDRFHPEGRPVSIIRCHPVTGRTHQIRLHLRAWGHPIVDDPIYGPEGDDSGGTLQNRSIRLMSSRLKIPGTGIDATCDLPADWRTPAAFEHTSMSDSTSVDLSDHESR